MTTLSPPTTGYPRTLPDLTAPRRGRRPAVAERVLPSGLRVLVVRRPSVPLVEVRLRIPFQPGGGQRGTAHLTRASVLSQTMLSGTADMSTVDIAAALQEVGGGLAVGVDPDRLLVSGNSLSTGLPRLLEVLAGVLTGATYPSGEVTAERDRLADRIEMAASQPAHAARKALLRRLYGTHPYAVQTPEPEEVRAVRPPALRTLHAGRVVPDGALLVLVGDVSPARTLDAVEAALQGWNGTADLAALKPAPDPEPGPLLLVDRSGSVQSSLRIGLGAIGRAEPEYPALQLANLVFGGYFSSRLVENIREDKGYTYSPHSSITHWQAGSVTVVDADVATEVTAPALLEMGYELGRIAALPPRQEELDQARQYAIGTLQLSVASQGGLAATLMTLAAAGLDLDWLYEQPTRLGKVTVDDVHAAASRHLAPSRAVTVVLGDAAVVAEPLAALGPVEEA
ncbi:MAG TPA: pitrilysin family protein [Mycobacteriales bacterium]|jgi:predicted Zn-dependent peptidase